MEEEKVKFIPKGMLKPIIILTLHEEPTHGYGLIKKIKERTGFWKPSPGTIYPILKSMVEKKLIKEIKTNDKTIKYALTKKGEQLAKNAKQIKEKMQNNLTNFLSESLEVDKEIIREKVNYHFNDCELLQLIRVEMGLLILIKKDKKKIKEVKKVLESTNKKIAEIIAK
ncbi:MAG TPA: PadR family transcriptional regulator [archaeon]|nr:PadR family transcriptional regulator [archaeon]